MNNVEKETGANREKRNRRTNQEIKKSIFDAVLRIVREKGFTSLSLNLISEYSNINPVTLGKRFRDVNDIIEQFIGRYDYWLDFFTDSTDGEPTGASYRETLGSVLDVIWKKKAIQQILAWQITEDSEIAAAQARNRDEAINVLTARYAARFAGSPYDIRLLTAILLAAISCLSACRRKSSAFGTDLKGHDGSARLLKGISQLSDLVFDKVEKTQEKETARKLMKYGDSIEKIRDITGLSKAEIEAL
jgi:AcrR family transcriptional regulator